MPSFRLAHFAFCDPAGIRTQDPYIKSVMLYRLSYGIIATHTDVGLTLFAGTISFLKYFVCGPKFRSISLFRAANIADFYSLSKFF